MLGRCRWIAASIVITFSPLTAFVQTESEKDPWALLRPLVGHWEGAIDGRLGTGRGVREYELILNEKFLMYRHDSVRMPQEKTPEGDHHRELSIFSFDGERGKLVLREFFAEGYVVRSVCEADETRLVCATEQVENGAGVRARLTIDFHGPYSFDETYELGFSGEEPVLYFTNRWTRKPALP